MYGLKRNNILITAFMFYGASLAAQNHQNVQDSVRIYFKQGKIDLVPTLRENQSALNRIADTMRITYADSAYQLRKILVVGGASPEGSVKFNRWLSEKRAKVLFDYLSRYGELPDSLRTTHYLGRDWNGLIRLVENDPQLPYWKETLSMLRQIASEQKSGAQAEESHLQKIQKLREGYTLFIYVQEILPAAPIIQAAPMVREGAALGDSETGKSEFGDSEIGYHSCSVHPTGRYHLRPRHPVHRIAANPETLLYGHPDQHALRCAPDSEHRSGDVSGKKMVGGCQLDVRMVEDRPPALVLASLRQ